MDLGLQGRRAIVCAASKGLGKACAVSLAGEGVDLVINSRSPDVLEATAEEIRSETGVTVTPVAADITTEEGRAAVLAACADPDILINNAGGPPPGDFRDWDRDEWIKAIDANMLTAIFLIKATVDGMIDRKFGRVVNITSAAVKAPIEILGLSNGLLPGPFATDRYFGNIRFQAEKSGKPYEEVLAAREAANPAGRSGDPAEFGDACAFLCSAGAGFITGQNLLMDGGSYPGTL
jgi:3-oxoacyl-[acyl-carrier protein] reductase